MANNAKCYGNIRYVRRTEAQLVLASGIYLTFSLKMEHDQQRQLVEIEKSRVKGQKFDLEIHPALYASARKAAFEAIIAHRATFHLPALPPVEERYRPAYQLVLPLRK